MKNTFTINGVTYTALPFDFNMVCDLEDMGIPIEEAGNKPMPMVRAYFAICSGLDKVSAGLQMQAHILKGENFDGLSEAMAKEMENSDFFRTLSENAEKEAPTTQKSKAKAQKQ